MKPAELLTVVAVVAVGVAWLSPTPRPVPALNLQLPAGVQVLQRQDHLALLRVDMEGHAGLDLELQFTGPHKDSSFHLSETNPATAPTASWSTDVSTPMPPAAFPGATDGCSKAGPSRDPPCACTSPGAGCRASAG